MAISANAVWEVRTAGNDTNGGGFATGASGSDYSMQDAKNTAGADISTTDAVAVGNTTITSATANFGTTIVGNVIYLAGGTGTLAAGWYSVTARANTTTITVDRNVATGTGITMNIGGALASPGVAASQLATGHSVWIKAGTYTITTASTNVANGCWSSASQVYVEGYQTTRGDLGTKPLIVASGISTFTLISQTSESFFGNLEFSGADLTSSRGLLCRGTMFRILSHNCTNSAIVGSVSSNAHQCVAHSCGTQPAFLDTAAQDCISYDNTSAGFSNAIASQTYVRCIADSNSGATTDGFISTNTQTTYFNCVAYNNGRDGFRKSAGASSIYENCIAETNGGFGILINNVNNSRLSNNATYNNTSGATSLGTGKFVVAAGAVTGSGSFFVDAPNQNFALNNTAGAGASARAAGFPGALLVGGTGYLDIGALQHQDSGSGGGAAQLVNSFALVG